jgi:hypothetical protein
MDMTRINFIPFVNIMKKRVEYVLVFLLFLLPRIFGLGTDISNSDALRWHNRSENFLRAMKRMDFSETYQKYHPGVPLMWVGAISSFTLRASQYITGSEIKTLENADFYPLMHGFSKLLLVMVLAGCFALQLYLVNRLYGKKISIIYGVLISIEPYFVGINRWLHLSSLEAFFATTSLLSILYYHKCRQSRFLYTSAVLAGLGVLTKMTVLITVFFIISLICFMIIKKKERLLSLGAYIVTVSITAFVLFPALWVDPVYVAGDMYSALFNSVTADNRVGFLTPLQQTFYYPLILFFKMSPFMFILGLTTLLFSIYKLMSKKSNPPIGETLIALYLVVLVIFLTVSEQKIDRYSIALFLPLILLSSITLSKISNRFLTLVLSLQLIHFAYATYIYYPVYSAYISPPVSYDYILKQGFYDNSGEYYSRAALYLNTKGRDIYTYAPNNVDSFFPYYKGKKADSFAGADYFVYGLDFDRKGFIDFPNCAIEKYFGNKLYKPVAVYKCN